MTKPLVSVITVVYNGAATLENTIRSVAGQTFRDWEYVIVDGGSTDDTLNIIKKNPDTVTRWISEKDKGVYDAMNKGIRLAQGEWLYFLGSDDLFQDDKVLKDVFGARPTPSNLPAASAAPSQRQVELLYGDVISPSYKGRYDGVFTFEKLLSRNISHQAAFYRKSLFDRLGDYDQHYRMHADWDFNLRCFSDPGFQSRYMDVLVASFGAEGISAGHDLPFLRERLIPAKLQWLSHTGTKPLRQLSFYDEWWRFLRNAGFHDQTLQEQYLPTTTLPRALSTMLRWQRRLPAKSLKNGLISKSWMFTSYFINRLTASI